MQSMLRTDSTPPRLTLASNDVLPQKQLHFSPSHITLMIINTIEKSEGVPDPIQWSCKKRIPKPGEGC